MHGPAWEFLLRQLWPYAGGAVKVVEFGSRDLGDGSPRCLFPFAERYTGIDIENGAAGVDVVTDAASWEPDDVYDVAISAETFEHTPRWPDIIRTARRSLKDDGSLFVVTCAGPGRAPHSMVGEEVVPPGEHYANVDPRDLHLALGESFFMVQPFVSPSGDLYVVARP